MLPYGHVQVTVAELRAELWRMRGDIQHCLRLHDDIPFAVPMEGGVADALFGMLTELCNDIEKVRAKAERTAKTAQVAAGLPPEAAGTIYVRALQDLTALLLDVHHTSDYVSRTMRLGGGRASVYSIPRVRLMVRSRLLIRAGRSTVADPGPHDVVSWVVVVAPDAAWKTVCRMLR